VALVGLAAFVVLCALALLALRTGVVEQPAQRRSVEVPRLLSTFETATALERSLKDSDFGRAREYARTVRDLIAGTLTVEEMKRQ